VQRIKLRVHGDYPFSAGQYLTVQGGGIGIPLSIASAPQRLPELELHYRSTPGAPEALAMDALLAGSQLQVSAAEGAVSCPTASQPLLLIAGGSGAAQAFSCAEHRSHQSSADTTVLWCADHADDLYDTDRLAGYVNGQLQICIDDRRTEDNEGLTWLREHGEQFRGYAVIICGSPGFVYAVTDLLVAQGMDSGALQADVYAYAPRG